MHSIVHLVISVAFRRHILSHVIFFTTISFDKAP